MPFIEVDEGSALCCGLSIPSVGGEMLDVALNLMNTFGRIIACGSISTYNAAGTPLPPWASPSSARRAKRTRSANGSEQTAPVLLASVLPLSAAVQTLSLACASRSFALR